MFWGLDLYLYKSCTASHNARLGSICRWSSARDLSDVCRVWCLMFDVWWLTFFLCFCFYVWLPCLMSEIRYLMCDLCKLMFCRCLIWILDEWDSMFDFRDAMFDAFYMLSASSADVARFLALLLFFLGYPAMVGVLSCSWKSWSWTLSPIRLFRSVTVWAIIPNDESKDDGRNQNCNCSDCCCV